MNELRDTIKKIVLTPTYGSTADGNVDLILDAVIEAMPEKIDTVDVGALTGPGDNAYGLSQSQAAYLMAYNGYRSEVITILEAAKSPDRDQVKEGV